MYRLRFHTLASMVALLLLALNLLAALFKSKSGLEAENAALRQQLIVLRRKVRGRIQLKGAIVCSSFNSIVVSVDPQADSHRPSRDAGALASSRVSPLLVLEVTRPGRSATDRRRAAGVDPTHELGKSALGCATHSR